MDSNGTETEGSLKIPDRITRFLVIIPNKYSSRFQMARIVGYTVYSETLREKRFRRRCTSNRCGNLPSCTSTPSALSLILGGIEIPAQSAHEVGNSTFNNIGRKKRLI